MRRVPVCALLWLLLLTCESEAAGSPQRDKIFAKFNRWVVTKWFPASQMAAVMDKLEPIINPNTTIEQLKNAGMSAGMGVLDAGQYAKGIGIGTSFLFRFGGFSQAINIVSTTLFNNMAPFAEQLRRVAVKQYADKVPIPQQFVKFYTLIDQFMTARRVGTMWCRAKGAFDKANKRYWSTIESSFKGILQFEEYNLATCCKSTDRSWDIQKCPK